MISRLENTSTQTTANGNFHHPRSVNTIPANATGHSSQTDLFLSNYLLVFLEQRTRLVYSYSSMWWKITILHQQSRYDNHPLVAPEELTDSSIILWILWPKGKQKYYETTAFCKAGIQCQNLSQCFMPYKEIAVLQWWKHLKYMSFCFGSKTKELPLSNCKIFQWIETQMKYCTVC